MNQDQKKLSKLSEECSELIQIAQKTLEWGPDSYHPADPERTSNKILLSRELADVCAVASFIDIDEEEFLKQFLKKRKFFKEKWNE